MINIKSCTTENQIIATYEIAKEQYNLTKEQYIAQMQLVMSDDYSLFAAYDDQQNMVAIIGYRVGHRLYCGKYLHIDNLVVGNCYRRDGIAGQLIDFIHKQAVELNCDSILADTYVENYPAHKLFMKEGLHIRGYHMREIL